MTKSNIGSIGKINKHPAAMSESEKKTPNQSSHPIKQGENPEVKKALEDNVSEAIQNSTDNVEQEKGHNTMNNEETIDMMAEHHANYNVGVFGCGACGCKAAHMATLEGFTTGGINTTSDDWADLDLNSRYAIANAAGSGQNPAKAKALLNQDLLGALTYFNDNFSHCHTIIIPFSTNGGSGAGMAPALGKLLQSRIGENVRIVLVPIMGDIIEPVRGQMNLTGVFEELESANVNYIALDNSRATDKSSQLSIWEEVNREFVEICLGIAKYGVISANAEQHIDTADYNMQFIEKDRMLVVRKDLDLTSSAQSIEEQIIAAVESSNQIGVNGFDLPSSYSLYINAPTEKRVHDPEFLSITNKYGKKFSEFFKHYQYNENEKPFFCFVMTKLGLPAQRLKEVQDRIDEYNQIPDSTINMGDIKKTVVNINRENSIKDVSDGSKNTIDLSDLGNIKL